MTMMTGVSYLKPARHQGFMSLLSSAVCEWFLIFMLLVDATLSYLLTKFALYCKLQVPCPLCSRIDHLLEKNKPDYIRTLFCSNHREEISSLVCCHNHDKLADICSMCEDCIVSSTRSKKPTSKSYRLLVGKLGLDIEDSGLKVQLLRKSFIPDYSVPRICSCCNRTLRIKSNTQRLIHLNSAGYGASKANVKPPLPRASSRSRFSRRENFKKLMNKFSGPMIHTVDSTLVDPLSHVGYTELKITSDSESEVPLSDEDDIAFLGKMDLGMEFQQDSQKLPRVSNDESGPSKVMRQTSKPLPSLLDQPMQLRSIEQNSMNSSTLNPLPPQVSEEINQLHTNPNPKLSALPELISLDDLPQSVENSKPNALLVPPSNLALLSELISLTDILPPPNVVKVSEKSPDTIGISHSSDVSISKNTTVIGFPNEVIPSVPNNFTSDGQLAPHNNAKGASGIPAATTSNSQKLEEDIISSSALPSSPNVDKSSKDTSTEMSYHHEIQRSDSPTCSNAIDMLQMAAALESHDSCRESIDGITVKEIEGETVVDRFKRQVQYDQRCIRALFRELEEERSAAAVAANQAMAMITRLQEEKASLHMEALQYLRMMEEQAEYDMEALEKANDLLAEKEKEIQDLEAEYEIHKGNFLDYPVKEDPHKGTSDTKGDDETHQSPHIDRLSSIDLSEHTKFSENICTPEQADSLASKLEDEKLYISQCLKKLELKFLELSRNGALADLSNGGYSAKGVSADDNNENLPDKRTQTSHPTGENGLSMHRDSTSSNGNHEKEKSDISVEENDFGCGESDFPDIHQHRLSNHGGEFLLESFRSQITNLQDRMRALEADGDMLIHALKTLQNGNDGLEFIQEIAQQLHELRNIEFKKRCLSIP